MTKKKNDNPILVNKLSVADAQHLYRLEGGFLSTWQIVYQLASICIVHALVAWAVYSAQATIWHMLLPMVAEYYAYLLAVPVCQAFVRHVDLNTISHQCLRVLAVQVVVIAAIGVGWPWLVGKNVFEHWTFGWEYAWQWVVGKQMHWPILLAGICSALNVQRNVGMLVKYGPPFAGPGVGCAMRAIIAFLAIVLVPAAAILIGPLLLHYFPGLKSSLGTGTLIWLAWFIFLAADLGRLYLRWDIQRRLHRAGKLPDADKPPV